MRTVAASAIRPTLATIALGAVLLAAAAAAVVAAAVPARAADMQVAHASDTGDTHDEVATTASTAPNAMRIYRDPATGAFVSVPPAGTTLPATHAFTTSTEALVETPGTSAAGGVTVDLRGNFQSAITATVDGSGTVDTHCHESTTDAPR